MSSSFYVNLILIFIVNSLPVISSGNAEHSFLRGVPPKRREKTNRSFDFSTLIFVSVLVQSKYVASKPFACLDGSANIPFEFVNDDYCDCRGETRRIRRFVNSKCLQMEVMNRELQRVQMVDFIAKIKVISAQQFHRISLVTAFAVKRMKKLFVVVVVILKIVLDCCDGSDEYETRVVCNNTCL